LELGRRVGLRQIALHGEKSHAGLGAVEGAVFALLGLLIAFSFSGAMSRFDARRHLIVDESNAIGTAWLRLDLFRPEAQPAMRELFRRYLDARLEVYRKLPDIAAAKAQYTEATKLEVEIWDRAVAEARASDRPQVAMLSLPAINQVIDLSNSEMMATQLHPPLIIFLLLALLTLGASFLAGHAMAAGKSRHWIHAIAFCLAMATTVYVILDIEYPLLGFIRIDSVHQTLVDLRQSMSSQP
jgi:hypothetical protein